MFRNRTIVALAAVSFVSCASAAFAEDADGKIGDRYPFLEQRYTPVATIKPTATAPTRRKARAKSKSSSISTDDTLTTGSIRGW